MRRDDRLGLISFARFPRLACPLTHDPDGMAGRIVMPALVGVPGELREDLNDADLGLPRDLSGDGIWDADDHSVDYQLLPVRVLIEWKSKSGNRLVELNDVTKVLVDDSEDEFLASVTPFLAARNGR